MLIRFANAMFAFLVVNNMLMMRLFRSFQGRLFGSYRLVTKDCMGYVMVYVCGDHLPVGVLILG